MNHLDPTRKEFYRTPRHNLLYNALEFAAILPFIILVYEALTNGLKPTPLIGGLFGGSFTLAIGMISIVLNQKLIISRTGIEYHVGWARMQAAWKDITGLGFRWGPLPRMEGLLVPATGERTPFEKFIPLSIFAEEWRTSELGVHIKKYAPHLLDGESPVQTAE